MFHIRLLSFRTSQRAEMWFFDCLKSFLVALALGFTAFVLAPRATAGHPWIAIPVILAASCWTLRVRLHRDEPTLVRATIYWLFIPVRRRSGHIDTIQSAYNDDWSAPSGAAYDAVELGRSFDTKSQRLSPPVFEFHCKNADEVVAWLRESAGRLGTPTAKVTRDQQ